MDLTELATNHQNRTTQQKSEADGTQNYKGRQQTQEVGKQKRVRKRHNQYLRSENPIAGAPFYAKKTIKLIQDDFSTAQKDELIFCQPMRASNEPLQSDSDVRTATSPTKNLSKTEENQIINSQDFVQYQIGKQTHLTEYSSGNEMNTPFGNIELLPENELLSEEETCDPFEDSGENDESDSPQEQFIYDGSSMTLANSLLLILTYSVKHELTGYALQDLLTLISLHCPSPQAVPTTLFKFKQWFSRINNPLKMHYNCSACFTSIQNPDSCVVCPTEQCSKLVSKLSLSTFIEIPVVDQVQKLFQRRGFAEDIKYRFTRVKQDINGYEDIFDGKVYKQLFGFDKPLMEPHNLTFTWNTDGVPVFKSSKFSVWPFFLVINELPFKSRTKRENILLGGLWFGPQKPAMLTFFKPVHDSLKQLENGVEVDIPTYRKSVCKAFVIAGTCDLPARSIANNTVQYNGSFGCFKCKQKGKTIKTPNGGHVHSFPCDPVDPSGPLRSHKETIQHAITALETNSPVFGIKGPTWLANLKYFDLIAGNAIDYMHCVLLGVMKKLMSLWFSSSFIGEDFNIYHSIEKINASLKGVKPPSEITRATRSLEHINDYKASEYRSWLLFYGLTVLKGLLPDIYFTHFALLSKAIFILLQDSVSVSEVVHAENLLRHFCFLFPSLYEERFATCNFHLLLHLPDCVRDLGPLWCYSCFHFEDANGFILKLVHGTQKVALQIANAVAITQNIPILEQLIDTSTQYGLFYKRLTESSQKSNRNPKGVVVLGRPSQRPLQQFHVKALAQEIQQPLDGYLCYDRVQLNSIVYESKTYARVTVRNNFTLLYWSAQRKKIGQIEVFVQHWHRRDVYSCSDLRHCDCEAQLYAIVQPMDFADGKKKTFISDEITDATARHIYIVHPPNPQSVEAVDVHCIITKCVLVQSSEKNIYFVCLLPNRKEKD